MKRLIALSIAMMMPALAQAATKSVYTDLNLEKCKFVPSEGGQGGFSACKGYKNIDVYVWEDDLRTSVTYGDNEGAQCSARQTFGQFNSPGNKIEWRVKDGKAKATILRFSVQTEDAKVSWLVVTKLDSGQACHAAYVKGSLKDANARARKLADEAGSFDCMNGIPVVEAGYDLKADDIAVGFPCSAGQ